MRRLPHCAFLLVGSLASASPLSALILTERPVPRMAAESLPDAPSFLGRQAAAEVPAGEMEAARQVSVPATPPAQETEAERKARIYAEASHDVKMQETQRIMAVVPNFNTVITGRAVPLSKGQKTDLALHATFDPFNLVGAFALAGVSELNGSHRGYGWGPTGYFKRVGANLADVVGGTMLAGAVYPILLHQDPRFFRKGTGSQGVRVRHALLAAFICRGDSGRTQPNYSNVLGNLTAGLISNAYYPAGDRGFTLAIVNSSIVTVEGALGNLALEFSPDVQRWLRRKKLAPAP